MTAPWKSFQQEGGNPFLRYFDAEMRYLHEAGREFARDQPDAARRLGMECSVQFVLTIDGRETVYPRTDFEGAPF